MKANGDETYLGFKVLAGASLGFPADDELELISLPDILLRLEELHSEEVSHFAITAERKERLEHAFDEIDAALLTFWERLKQMIDLPQTKFRLFQCVPLDPTIFKSKAQSDTHHRFLQTYQEHYQLNEGRGRGLLEFMLAHYMQEATQFKSFDRGLRSRLRGYAISTETLYSIWEGNKFGRIWSFPGSDLPNTAYASAHYRLIDALFSIDFKTAYDTFKKYLNPLQKFPVQFLYNVIIEDPKTLLQDFAQAAPRKELPVYDVQRIGGQDHAPEFHCKLFFLKRAFEATDRGKSIAEKKSARSAIDFIMANERGAMSRFIADKISAGTDKIRSADKPPEVPAGKLTPLRRTLNVLLRSKSLKVSHA